MKPTKFEYIFMFTGMAVVAIGQIATINNLWIGTIGTLLMPLMLTVFMKLDKHDWLDPKIIILWSGFLIGAVTGLILYFTRPILHLPMKF